MPAGNDSGNRRTSGTSKKNAHCSFCRKIIAMLDPWSKGQAMSTFVEIALNCASRFWNRSNVVEDRQNSYSTRF